VGEVSLPHKSFDGIHNRRDPGGTMKSVLTGLALLLAFQVLAFSPKLDDKVADRLFESAKALGELLNAPDGGAPRSLL
jgi:hypothetical protein